MKRTQALSHAAAPAPGEHVKPEKAVRNAGSLLARLRKPLFPGWFVVAGAFLVLAVGYGAAYSFAAFAYVLEREFTASHSSVSAVYSICGCTAFGFSAISGPLADRLGCRLLVSIGMLLVGFGLALAAAADDLQQILLSYGLLIGLGIGFAYVPAVAAVQRWFVARRGLASGIAAAGIGFGTTFVPPASQALIAVGGWRHAFLVMGAAATVLGLAGALLLAHAPEHRGLLPDGAAAATAPTAERPGPGLGAMLRGWRFALIYLGCFAVSIPVALPFAHLPASAQAKGIAWADALALLSLVGVGSIAGRFLLGALADLAGRRRIFLACCWGVAAATAWWSVCDGLVALSVFALAFGAAYGGFVALLPAFIVDLYGRASAGSVIGVLYTSRALALLASPFLVVGNQAGLSLSTPLSLCALSGAMGTALLTLAARSPR